MTDKQFNTLVQMIAQLSERIEEVNTNLNRRIDELSARIGALEKRMDSLETDLKRFKQQTHNNFRDQATMLQEIATAFDTKPTLSRS